MSTKSSTGLRNYIVATGSLRAAFNGNCQLSIFGGAEVSGADSAAGSSPLVVLTSSGGGSGLEFEAAASSGNLLKLASQTWQGDPTANGTATWWRLEELGDTRLASTTAKRLQGSIGQVVGDIVFTNPAVVTGTPKQLNNFAVSIVGE